MNTFFVIVKDVYSIIKYNLEDVFNHDPIIDARGIPTAVCPMCGCGWFTVHAAFDDDYEISAYMLNAACDECGTLVTAPTPEDVVAE